MTLVRAQHHRDSRPMRVVRAKRTRHGMHISARHQSRCTSRRGRKTPCGSTRDERLDADRRGTNDSMRIDAGRTTRCASTRAEGLRVHGRVSNDSPKETDPGPLRRGARRCALSPEARRARRRHANRPMMPVNIDMRLAGRVRATAREASAHRRARERESERARERESERARERESERASARSSIAKRRGLYCEPPGPRRRRRSRDDRRGSAGHVASPPSGQPRASALARS
jgi:hypothetical protein